LHLLPTAPVQGVQIGVEQISQISMIREKTIHPMLIGVSCHSTTEVAHAQVEGADFVTLSPIFPTRSKPNATQFISLQDVAACQMRLKLPIYPLGGIGRSEVALLNKSGLHRFACIEAVLGGENPIAVASRVRYLMDSLKLQP
jgi:thiamine-phosphate pyrophosphorylase